MRISVLSFSVPVALCAMTPVRASSQSAPAVRSNDPLVHSHVRATLPDSTFWPEGVDADPRTGSLYVASVRHRTIAEVDATGKTRELIPRDQETLGAIFGVRVDTARNVLWATTSGYHQVPGYVAADSAVAALLEISITDGRIVDAGIPRWPPVGACWAISQSAREATCSSPTPTTRCCFGCTAAKVSWTRSRRLSSALFKGWRRVRTGAPSMWRTIREGSFRLRSRD